MYSPPLKHAEDIATQIPQVHNEHPFKHKANHEKLLNYLQARLRLGLAVRDGQLERYAQIDRDVAGWMQLSDDDRERKAANERTGIPQAVEMNLPLTYVHIDDMMTYFAETFSPNRGMFYHTGKPDEVTAATQIVTLMNNHALYTGLYRQTMLTIFSILKYNLGGFYNYWTADYGPKIEQDATGATSTATVKIWEGNKSESLDIYNTFWDPSVHPTLVYKDAEWAGRAFLRSHYWLAERAARGVYYNCDEALKNDTGLLGTTQYYRSPPDAARMQLDESTSGKTNWVSVLSGSPAYAESSGFEFVEVIIRLNPNNFGLVAKKPANRNRFETWRITILNDKFIIEAEQLSKIHGQIPFYFGLANDDCMGTAAKSVAEILKPLQDFASVLLNTHVKANRKKIWGLTVFDPTVVNFDKIPAGEVAAYIPIEGAGYGRDIRESIVNINDSLETNQTMQDLGSVMQIIDQFFPTQSLPSQIASIDRAIDSQVAAVQQGSNRRQHKTAKLLDDSLFRPLRGSMYYNIVQFQPDNATVNDFTGRSITVNLEELRATDLPFIIGQGLKAIDRMMIASRIQNVIFALIQAPDARQEIDLLKLLDYWTSMLDIDIDFEQFRKDLKQLQAEKAAAAQGEEGAGPPIQPAVDPAAVTAPIRNPVS